MELAQADSPMSGQPIPQPLEDDSPSLRLRNSDLTNGLIHLFHEIWISKKFPYKWKLYKKIFLNESWADINIFFDRNGDKWLFGNKSSDKYLDHNSELYIYKIMDNNFNKLIPHKLNPVITNCFFNFSKISSNLAFIIFEIKSLLIFLKFEFIK